MANPDVVRGLRPAMYLNGAPYNGKAGWYYIPSTDATAVYLGDLVKLGGSADADGVPSVTKASSTNNVLGVVVAVHPTTQASTIYRAASTAAYVYVADDPNILFEIQEDSAGGALTADSVGLNANLIDAGGSTVTGFSGVELDSSTAAADATYDFVIYRLARRPDNAIGTNAKWLVKLNNHQYADSVVGVS